MSTAGTEPNAVSVRRNGSISKNERPNGERHIPPEKSSNRRSTSRRKLSNGRHGCSVEGAIFSTFPGTFAGLSAMTHLQCELHCPLTPVTVRYISPRVSSRQRFLIDPNQ